MTSAGTWLLQAQGENTLEARCAPCSVQLDALGPQPVTVDQARITLHVRGADRYDALAEVLLDDRLYVNSASGTCGIYLGLEGEVVGALPAGMGGCGGRTPNDDVIERSYSVLAAGTLTGVDDLVTGDAREHSADVFPFLAEPN